MDEYYPKAKLAVLEELDETTNEQLVKNYGGKFTASSKLFLDLGIPVERMAVMAPRMNDALDKYPRSSNVTSAGLARAKTIGDLVTLFCKAAKITIPQGEPR